MAKPLVSVPGPDRNKFIYQMLCQRGSIKVAELQDLLGVSNMTVRRCLNEMADDGLLRRVHGGAVALSAGEQYSPFQNKLVDHYDVKLALAGQAVEMVPEAGSVYLDAGTTCYVVAKKLAESGKKCMVITDSLAIVTSISGRSNIDALLLGGKLSGDNNTLDGPLTAEVATKFSVDLAVISACGFNLEQLENRSMTGTLTKKIMIQRAAKALCVADSGKYGKQSCFRFCGWDEIDEFITDAGLPEEAGAAIAAKGVRLRLVDVR